MSASYRGIRDPSSLILAGRCFERDANAPGVLRYNPDEVETAAYGPRKGLNPPIKNLRQSETLTSSPRDADAGR